MNATKSSKAGINQSDEMKNLIPSTWVVRLPIDSTLPIKFSNPVSLPVLVRTVALFHVHWLLATEVSATHLALLLVQTHDREQLVFSDAAK